MIRFWRLSCLVFLVTALGCSVPSEPPMSEQQAITAWADLAIDIAKNTSANSPTYASRCFGYMGLTMYESVVQGYPGYQSLSGQLNGFHLQTAPAPGQTYSWILCMNAAQASILRDLYNQTRDENKRKIDSVENHVLQVFKKGLSEAEVNRSIAYGHAVANEIFAWSRDDGGHRGYLANFDRKFKTIAGPGHWEPPLYGQSFSHYPLHPHWGKNRPFLISSTQTPAPAIIPFDTVRGSSYYNQHFAVYEHSKKLTDEEKEIALWWGDDPSDTFTPPGHSIYLTTQVIRQRSLSLIECAEAYARVGMGVADAFTLCWKWKYQYCSERPSSYITKYIDDHWESFWPDPPFPAFPSGHAIQAGTTSAVLIDLFGPACEVIDSAHVWRSPDELRNVSFKPRKFSSFWQIAEEVAASRFYGGIHSRQDNSAGLEEGKRIAKNLNELQWKKSIEYVKASSR